jgi:hypothetical protein
MKKIYSFVAALVVAMVVLASCGASSAYQAQLDAAKSAIEAKDATTAFAKVKEVIAGDKVTVDDALLSTMYAMAAYGIEVQKANGQLDAATNLDLCKQVAEAYNKVKSFPEAEVSKSNDALKIVSGQDVMGTAAQYVQNIANLESQIQAAQQAAEAEAEGEGEEEEAE